MKKRKKRNKDGTRLFCLRTEKNLWAMRSGAMTKNNSKKKVEKEERKRTFRNRAHR